MTRRDVFDAAKNVSTAEDALDLYVLMCGWGAGVQGRTGYRCRLPLNDPDLTRKLLGSYEATREGTDPVEVYQDLQSGQFKVKHFGPAFFTKWMYFAGYEQPATNHPKPLILDARVATSLGWAPWGWSPSDYGRYLELTAKIAEALGEAETHVVEHALFTLRGDVVLDEPESGMRSVVVNDVPKEVHAKLVALAEVKAQTLEDLVLDVLTQTAE